MSLRSAIRKMLEERRKDSEIVRELQCSKETVDKVRELVAFESSPADDTERVRRGLIATMPRGQVSELAKKAGLDPATLKRVLLGLTTRPYSVALARPVLERAGLAVLLVPGKLRRVR